MIMYFSLKSIENPGMRIALGSLGINELNNNFCLYNEHDIKSKPTNRDLGIT